MNDTIYGTDLKRKRFLRASVILVRPRFTNPMGYWGFFDLWINARESMVADSHPLVASRLFTHSSRPDE